MLLQVHRRSSAIEFHGQEIEEEQQKLLEANLGLNMSDFLAAAASEVPRSTVRKATEQRRRNVQHLHPVHHLIVAAAALIM